MRLPSLHLFTALLASAISLRADQPWVVQKSDGTLEYKATARGDRIPDFSNVGYHGGDAPVPMVPVVATVEPAPGDAGARLQAAIDQVAQLPLSPQGSRGAILIKKGRYPIAGSLFIRTGGIVLRGEGQGPDGTVLIATGAKQRSLIIVGAGGRKPPKDEDDADEGAPAGAPAQAKSIAITDPYVPVGAHSFHLADASALSVGREVIIHRPSTANWIHDIGMDRIPSHPGREIVQWRAGTKDLYFSRVITKIANNEVTVDAPITCALDQKYGGGRVMLDTGKPAPSEIGVENLRGESEYKSATDEKHGWIFVDFAQTRNSWVREVTAVHFGYSCVFAQKPCKWITVDHCACIDPVSQITGGRRYSFAVDGQLTLVEHCYSRNGRHDFVMHALAAGPDVFYDCVADHSHADSGPHHRWSVGVLYDNVRVSGAEKSGGEINLRNRGNMGTGHGWAGANQVVWNCTADAMIIENPPTAQNWVIGAQTGSLTGDGFRESIGKPVLPKSLYQAQLEERHRSTPL